MKRFKKILCYVGGAADPSPGLQKAADLAEQNQAELTLIDILLESTEGPWLTLPGELDLEMTIVAARRQEISEMALPVEERAIAVEIEVLTGNAFVEMIRKVEAEGFDLVIKTAQGNEGRLGGMLGSTATHLFRKCPSPVWVVKPDANSPNKRILAAVQTGSSEDEADEFAIRVLELSASLAERSESRLDIVHAWWLYSEAMLRSPRLNVPPAEVDRLLREVRLLAEQKLDRILENIDLSRVEHKIHLVKGKPFEVIGELARKVDVVVMGTLSRAGIEGLLIGNTAERVLRDVDCSILAAKPEGFRTPLHF